MKLFTLSAITVLTGLAAWACEEGAYFESDPAMGAQGLSGECVVYVDANALPGGTGESLENAVTTVDEAIDIAEDAVETADACSINVRGTKMNLADFEERLRGLEGRVRINDFSIEENPDVENEVPTRVASLDLLEENPETVQSREDEMDYMPYATCSCDTFTGRVEFSATTDANGSPDSGVIEVGNSLRIDGNEMITNTGTTLYLQHGNNGDLHVDSPTLFVDASTDRVGIGTTSPATKLHVDGNITMDHATFEGWVNNWSGMNIITYILGTEARWFDIKDQYGAMFARFNSDDDSLNVDGPVRAGDFIVDLNLADYVFDDNYDLKSLEEVEAFIEDNNHLPDMPSAADVDAEGLPLADFNNLLLQKVEELTLHVIEQNKQIKALQKQMAARN